MVLLPLSTAPAIRLPATRSSARLQEAADGATGPRFPEGPLIARPPASTDREIIAGRSNTMDALINQVAERAGISQDKARQAVDTVIGFLEERAPAGLSGQIDSLVRGGEGSPAGGIASAVGGMLGGAKPAQ
jgi:hypothetical protein